MKIGHYMRSAPPALALWVSLSMSGAPALAQGAQQSAPLDFARDALALKPGEFVWAPEIAPSGPVSIVVDLSTQRATIYRNGVRIGVTTVSTGKRGHETPSGVFSILAKDAHHRSSKYNNAKMPYTQKLTQDGVALHAGGLPGYPESHGCVHLPLALAQKLFTSTTYSTTVVISGRAGMKADEVFGGVLAPVNQSGKHDPHVPLAVGESYRWRPELAPEGPVAFILSVSDQRLVVMRNGVEIGRAKVAVDVGSLGTHVMTMVEAANGARQWVLVGVAGHADEANLPVSSDLLSLIHMPTGFQAQVAPLVVPGTTVLVTMARINKHTTGANLAVLTGAD
ncbi:L,D-transpeptidase family protein [uncultured Rhodoblastus sp.]|uniref:L,D-transpeptidase family protein n=1 Tax=uncultured Rhodoblastus sp. TaxID=543037 RepID=UPI0025ED25DE|nr:L,D-transpeptidase family protein [uncultured Rhodoblastus sp.]